MRLTSFWPLLLIIAALAAWVWRIAPQNLSIIPYKMLIVCIAVYASHLIDKRFFRYGTTDETARAIVYGATVLAMAFGL